MTLTNSEQEMKKKEKNRPLQTRTMKLKEIDREKGYPRIK